MAHHRELSLIQLVYLLPDGETVTVTALDSQSYQIADSAGIVLKYNSLNECAIALAGYSSLPVQNKGMMVGPLRSQLGGLSSITD